MSFDRTLRVTRVVVALILAACAGDTAVNPGVERTAPSAELPALTRDTVPPFQTDLLGYELVPGAISYTGDIGVTWRNRTNDTLFITNCGFGNTAILEKRIGASWVFAWTPISPACVRPPVIVAPGASYHGVIPVLTTFVDVPNAGQRFVVVDIPGVYRLRWTQVFRGSPEGAGLLPVPGFAEQIAQEQRVSNPFLITLAPR